MNLDPEDYRSGELLGHDIAVLALRPGDVLICRPKDRLSQAQTEAIHRQLNTMMGENPKIRILVVPPTWDIGVARCQGDDEAIEGLRELVKEFSGQLQ